MLKSVTLITILLSLSSAVVLPRAPKISYDGFKVFRIATNERLETVKKALEPFADGQWNRDISQHIDIAIAPNNVAKFEALGLNTTIMHDNLGAAIAAEAVDGGRQALTGAIPDTKWFDTYHAYTDHQQYLKDLQSAFPKNSKLINSGVSYEGRPIVGLHLWGSGGEGSKPAVLFHGNVHAREWITSMVVEYITYNLVTQYGTDNTVKSILDKYDFYIIPFVNPDGFVYSQSTDRLWRKNRQLPPKGAKATCYGRDINRNWPYQWDSNPAGASTDPCAETYRGVVAGDAPENQGLVNLVQQLRASTGIKLYIDWHSYGQYMLSPYGYNCSLVTANNAKHQSLAAGTVKAISSSAGTKFTYGPSCSTLYATTGSSTDYLYDIGKAELSYVIELRDKGANGFVLPPSQIRPSGVEVWEGMKSLLTSM